MRLACPPNVPVLKRRRYGGVPRILPEQQHSLPHRTPQNNIQRDDRNPKRWHRRTVMRAVRERGEGIDGAGISGGTVEEHVAILEAAIREA